MKYLTLFSRCCLCLVIILMACNTKPQISKLHIDSTTLTNQFAQKGFRFHAEYFVIKNPPKCLEHLQSLIDSANAAEQFLPEDSQDYRYERIYYKETRFTPRDYKEGADLGFWEGKDDIIGHNKDLLVVAGWFRTGCSHGVSYMFYNKGKTLEKSSKVILDSNACK
jgi:hypothetical protein